MKNNSSAANWIWLSWVAAEVHMIICILDHVVVIVQSLLMIFSTTNWVLRLPHLITSPTQKLVHLPFLLVFDLYICFQWRGLKHLSSHMQVMSS